MIEYKYRIALASAISLNVPPNIKKRCVFLTHLIFMHLNYANGIIDASILISLYKEKQQLSKTLGASHYTEIIEEIFQEVKKKKLKANKYYDRIKKFEKLKEVTEEKKIRKGQF